MVDAAKEEQEASRSKAQGELLDAVAAVRAETEAMLRHTKEEAERELAQAVAHSRLEVGWVHLERR